MSANQLKGVYARLNSTLDAIGAMALLSRGQCQAPRFGRRHRLLPLPLGALSASLIRHCQSSVQAGPILLGKTRSLSQANPRARRLRPWVSDFRASKGEVPALLSAQPHRALML
jgi:hypothetical protein